MAVTVTDADGVSLVGTSSGGITVTAPVGSVIVVYAMTGGDTTIGCTDNRSHSYTGSTKRVVPSGTISAIQAFWTTVTTANPTITVTRSTSGQLAVRILVLDGATTTGLSEAGNAAAGATSLSIGSVSGTGLAITGIVVSSTSTGPLVTAAPSFTRESWQNMGSISRVAEVHTRAVAGSISASASWSSTRTSAAITLIIPEAAAPPAGITGVLFDGTNMVNVELIGYFDGTSILAVEPVGQFNGATIEAV